MGRLVTFWVVGHGANATGKNEQGLPQGIGGVQDSFRLLSKWSDPPSGTHWILGEFYSDQYELSKLQMPLGECFVDIGGNIGMFSLVVSKMYPGVRGSTFEPSPLNFLLNYANM